ncbi:DALR anticodon-binding domain-containing protein [Actinopolymorpha sp. B9G3]|uniref:DALR anticodon-binding domain-containing protein n=1 Tax=Actinopolymorpha sp. B9G3 TaxID=3158970 RepID=UPI0032D98586
MFPARLAAAIRTAIAEVVPPTTELPDATPAAWIRRPRRVTYGDFATPAARRWSVMTGIPTAQLAERLAAGLRGVDGVAECEVAGDGFVNIRVDARALADIVREIVKAGPGCGRKDHPRPEDPATIPRYVPSPALADEMRYAHARMCGFLRAAGALGIDLDPDHDLDHDLDPDLDPDRDSARMTTERIRPLVCALAEFPAVVARSGRAGRPERTSQRPLDRYLNEVLRLVERFEDAGGILPKGPEEPSPSHRTRLLVVDATRIVLADALGLRGLDAPTHW